MQNEFKKFLYAGVDLAAAASEKFQKSVTELVENGKISSAEGKKLVDEFLDKTEQRKEEFEAKFNELKEKVGFTKKTEAEELEDLRKKVADLEAKVKADKATATKAKATA